MTKKKKFNILNIRTAIAYTRRLYPYVRNMWPQVLLIVLGMALYAGGYAARLLVIRPFPELAQGVSDGSVSEVDQQWVLENFLPMGAILFGSALALAIGTFLKQYCMGWVTGYVVVEMQRDMVDKILKQPMAFFNEKKNGVLISRMTRNTGAAGGLVRIAMESAISHPLTMLAVIGAMLYTSPMMTLLTFVVFPIVMVPVFLFAKKIRGATKRQLKKAEESSNFFLQMLDGIRIVKSYRLEDTQRSEFENVSEDVFKRGRKIERYKGVSKFGVELTYNMIMAFAIVGVGFAMTTAWFANNADMGMFLQFFAGLIFLYDPARKLGHSLNNIQQNTAALDDAFALMDREPEIQDKEGAKEAPHAFETIKFDDVNFEYIDGQQIIKGISFEVKRGQMIGLVGQSGHGKSTLMDLIPRFYDPTSGSIKVDGHDLREVTHASWMQNIAIVSQDTFLFNTTIRQNILAGRPDASEDEVIEAAKAAHVWEDIEKMADGLSTKLGDRGITVSGGQRQRIAIARAFLRKAPILLLDEATASLDTKSERHVQEALDGLIKECTVFAVAHRLSTIRNADQIIVIHDGQIAEQGTHDELVKLKGAYASAFALQSGEADTEVA
ncbi:MAG: ABC transporter ATP-binding protein/permease [Planctomycetes bacterium]|nr:ABC transporter ATP-binding protein/permease [Planctomycetota bacterium]